MTRQQLLQRAKRLGEGGGGVPWFGLDLSDVAENLALSRSGSHAL